MNGLPDIKAYDGEGKYIFISYSHKDKVKVYPFIAALQKKYNVWFDEGIQYGNEWEEEIALKLENCSVFVFMITNNSLNSNNCKDELNLAREINKNFINIMIDSDVELPRWFQLRYGRYQMCNLYTFPSSDSAVDDLSRKCSWFQDLIKRDIAAEEKAKREAEEKAKREAEEKAKREAEENAKREAEEKAKREAEEKAKREAEEKAKREADEKAKLEAEEKAKREADEKAKLEAEANAMKCRIAEPRIRKSVPVAFIIPAIAIILSVILFIRFRSSFMPGLPRISVMLVAFIIVTVIMCIVYYRIYNDRAFMANNRLYKLSAKKAVTNMFFAAIALSVVYCVLLGVKEGISFFFCIMTVASLGYMVTVLPRIKGNDSAAGGAVLLVLSSGIVFAGLNSRVLGRGFISVYFMCVIAVAFSLVTSWIYIKVNSDLAGGFVTILLIVVNLFSIIYCTVIRGGFFKVLLYSIVSLIIQFVGFCIGMANSHDSPISKKP